MFLYVAFPPCTIIPSEHLYDYMTIQGICTTSLYGPLKVANSCRVVPQPKVSRLTLFFKKKIQADFDIPLHWLHRKRDYKVDQFNTILIERVS